MPHLRTILSQYKSGNMFASSKFLLTLGIGELFYTKTGLCGHIRFFKGTNFFIAYNKRNKEGHICSILTYYRTVMT